MSRTCLKIVADALFGDRYGAARTILGPQFGEEQPQEMIDLGQSCDRGFAASLGESLLNRHARRYAFDMIHIRALQLFDKLARISRHAIQKSALAFRKKNIKSQTRLS